MALDRGEKERHLSNEPRSQAESLLRSARVATLATQHEGQPYAALVTHAIAHDGAALVLLSGLSEHTRHLKADAKCALLVVGQATGANPQTAPRLTFLAHATPSADPALRERWLAIHPYAAFYAGLPDFQLWRLAPIRGHLVAGFGAAHALAVADLVVNDAVAGAFLDAEPDILARCNGDHATTLDAIARMHAGADGAGWRMVAADAMGCDLAHADRVIRISWSAAMTHPSEVWAELVSLSASGSSA